MNIRPEFALYLLVMAGVTYLIRMLPLTVFRKEIKSKFILSFLHYIPYAVLSAMVVPAVFYTTGSVVSAAVGFLVAFVMAFIGKSLVTVAACSCVCVFLAEVVMNYVI